MTKILKREVRNYLKSPLFWIGLILVIWELQVWTIGLKGEKG